MGVAVKPCPALIYDALLLCCSYLHKTDTVHGNLSLATIFIQHNGLIKIGSGRWVVSQLKGMAKIGLVMVALAAAKS